MLYMLTMPLRSAGEAEGFQACFEFPPRWISKGRKIKRVGVETDVLRKSFLSRHPSR